MNKIFRVIWNHATQSWVAVSELASVKGKTKSKTISKLASLLLVTCSSIVAEHAMAATYINQTKVSTTIADATKQIAILQGSSQAAKSSNGTILISNNPLVRDGSIKIGFDIGDSSTGNAGDTIIGNYVKTGGGEKDSLSTAVGYGTQVAGPSVSIGVGSSSDIGDASGWNAVQNSGVAIGAFSRVSGQTTTTNGGVAIGAVAFADQGLGGSVAVGQLSGAATLMYDREVTADGILVPVNETGVDNSKNLTSIGYKAGARSSGGVAIGENATTSSFGANAIAMGTASAAIKSGSIAIGHEAIAGGYSNKDDIAKLTTQKGELEKLESSQQKRFDQKTKDMNDKPTAENKYQVASAKAALERIKLAIERINADIKRLSTDDSITTNAIAIGHQSKATHQSALAMGDNAQASGKNSLAQGNRANATAESAMAQGDSSTASGIYAVAQGRKANATANFTIAQGNTAVASAVSAIASGNQAKATAESAVAQGDNALSSGIYAIAQGRKANATANFTIAQGNSAVASAVSAIASGNQAKATADSAVAQGNNANAAADSAVAQGNSAKATGAYAIAQGRKAEATANFTIAQGNSANASAQYAMALGNQAKANIEHGVALGSSSETTVAKGVTGFNPTAQGTSDIRANAYAPLNGNALTSTLAGVSVGSATNTRQINHVAAGTADDDAVNVAQLRSVNLKIAGNTNGETASEKSADMRNTATSKADVLLDSQTLNVVSSNTDLLTTDATNNTITIKPKTTKVSVNTDKTKDDSGQATIPTANGLVTATDLADTLNSMYWKATSAATTDGVVSGTEVQPVKAGNTVTFEADKNIKITQDKGKFTFATKDDVEFNTVTVGKPAEVYTNKDGKPLTKTKDGKYTDPDGNEVPEKDVVKSNVSPVKLATEKAIPANNNQDGKAPTTALNVTSTDGKPTQITGVGSVLSNESVPTNTNGTPNNQPNLVNLGTKPDANGKITPLPDNVLNSAATVRDLANMGWVVGAPENGYVDTVKNANKVDFKGENGISVTGKTNDKGVREITIAVKDGEVVKPNQFTAKVNGTDTPVTKVGDQYYNTADIDPKTGKPKADKKPVTPDAGTTPTNAGDGYVTGNKVAAAIQKSGFVVGKQKDALSAADFKDEDEKVNPDDELRFADGNNTKVKLATKESVDKDGNKVTTTTVKVDVTGLPVQYTAKVNGKDTPVTKVGDKYFTVDDKGNPTTTEVAPADLTTNMVNPAAKPNEIGAPTTLGNVKSNLPSVNDADKNAKDVDGNPIAGKDNKSAPIDAAKAADIAKNVGNNAATVSDVLNAGWNLQNNGKAKDFVKPCDTVNFVDGKGTKAVVKTEEDGTTSNVKFDIDTGSITNNADGSVQGPVVTPEMTKALEDATNTLNNLPANAPASVRKAAEQAVADAANNIANVANKVATAQDVANAINKSGFTLTTSANGGEKISGTPEMINPGKKVEMVAGKNMTVKQESNGKVTYATASNVTFDSVQFGDNGPKITNNGGNINVGTATGAPTKITGVAPGEISATSKDAVNGSQLHAMGNKLQGQINKLGNRMNAGMATSAAMANLLQPHKPGQSVATAGVGQHKNQSAVAVGYSRISDNGKYGVRFSMGANTQGEVTGGAAVGYFW